GGLFFEQGRDGLRLSQAHAEGHFIGWSGGRRWRVGWGKGGPATMKVSVVTPSFNQGVFIERTLLSVRRQEVNGFDIEHFVVDGGSSDSTLDTLRRFGETVQWVSEADYGQSHAVNKGIRATGGSIIGWLNSDDVYYPGAVNYVVDYLNANPQVDVVYGMAEHIDEQDRPFEDYPTEPWDLE